jgi:D-glycero-D-manno-heptose 1,7-bisphosphate phosphatase
VVGRAPAGGIFLDRDGVLISVTDQGGVTHPPASADDMRLLPGVVEAVAELRGTGAPLIVVTNQPDIARGKQTAGGVQAINDRLSAAIELDAILVCPHDNADGCDCRKPKPGLLVRGALQCGVDLARSVMVGDRLTDIQAGRAAGCATVLISVDPAAGDEADLIAPTLLGAVPWIVAKLR